MKINFFKSKKTKKIFVFIFLLGLILRIYNLKDTFIFEYDQARDAQRVYEIIKNKDIKIVGPETDIIGLHHGPLHYYLILPFYFLSNFNPNVTVYLFIFLNLLTSIPLYLTAKILFNKEEPALIATFLWMISYAQLNYSRYISNAAPMSLGAIIFFMGIAYYLFKKQDIKYLYISIIGLVIGLNFNFLLVYLIIFYSAVFFFKVDTKKYIKDLIKGFLLFLILTSNFIIAEIKWKFIGIKSLLDYLIKNSNNSITLHEVFSSFLNKFNSAIYNSFFLLNSKFITIFFLFIILLCYKTIKSKKKYTFLLIWISSTFPLFIFKTGATTADFINNSIYPALTIAVAGGIYYLLKKRFLFGVILTIMILISNFLNAKNDKFQNVRLTGVQRILFKDEKRLVDYTYNQSKGKSFSICAVTNPLFINTTWSFLYKFYGEKKYGYLPYWSGPDQHLNTSYLPYDTERPKLRFLILEPKEGIPDYAFKATLFLENHVSELIEEKKFGEIIVQKRILLPKPKKITEEELNKSEVGDIIKTEPRYSCYR